MNASPLLSPGTPIAVLGAGTMGHGIAHVCTLAGHPTRLYDVTLAAARTGAAKIRDNMDKGVAKGKVTEAQRDAAIRLLSVHEHIPAAVEGVAAVIEAVPEILDLKRALFGEIAKHVAEDTILASNTSSLSIATIAAGLPRPDRVIGLHFFNPVHVMKLLEIIRADATDPAVVEASRTFGERIGKTCVVVADTPGFATSRLGLVIGLEAMRMVEQGVASAQDIDTAMKLGYGFPMGPLELTDLVGLDVRLKIAEYLSRELPDGAHFTPPQILRDKVAQGHLGKKSGQGFYPWT
jgi:3-hydroxybutyryl-CoA dehydrogenase